jgi:hypothetical protein
VVREPLADDSILIVAGGSPHLDHHYVNAAGTGRAPCRSVTVSATRRSVMGATALDTTCRSKTASTGLRLHFAEIWWGVSEWIGWDNTGRRVFSVSLEDEEVLSDLDIWAEVGPAAPLVRTFYTSVDDGVLDIEFDAKADYATICTIEIDGEQVLSQLENATWSRAGPGREVVCGRARRHGPDTHALLQERRGVSEDGRSPVLQRLKRSAAASFHDGYTARCPASSRAPRCPCK